MQRLMNRLVDGAPCVVVGRGLGALYWASMLQKKTYTILLTRSEYAVDPYLPAIQGAGFSTEGLAIRPREVLKPGTVLSGRMAQQRSNQIHVALSNGSMFWLPVSAVLNCEAPHFLVNDRIWGEGCGAAMWSLPGFQSGSIILAGHQRSAATVAIELLVNRPSSVITWVVEQDEEVPTWSMHIVDRLGGRIHVVPVRNEASSDVLNRNTDQRERAADIECSFFLPDSDISPDGELFEQIFTCISSADDIPTQQHDFSIPFNNTRTPLVLSQKAQDTVLKLGLPPGLISERSLEQRMSKIRTLIRSIRGGDRQSPG